MSHNPMHDSPVPHFDGAHHRRAAPPRPLLTNVPLPHNRERRQPPRPPKKRKTVIPPTPALSFHPRCNTVPSGKQDPPPSPSVYSRPSTSESSSSSQDEQQATLFGDHGQFYHGYDAPKRLRVPPGCSSAEHSPSFCPDTPSTDVNDLDPAPHDFYDSHASYTSPAPPDQSACAAEMALRTDYVRSSQHMFGYSGQGYGQQHVVHQDPYGYSMGPFPDRPAQNYPVQYPDPAYGRLVSHGLPAYPDSNGYSYPPRGN